MAKTLHHQYDFSLILACYNEAEHFQVSIKEILAVLDKTDWTYEVIFVDDCSTDCTLALINDVIKTYPNKTLSVFMHKENQGRGVTVGDGIKKARGRMVGYIDFDLEVSAWYMPQFIECIDNGVDIAIGWRIYDISFSKIHRWIASKGYNVIRKLLLHTKSKDTEAGYKFFKRSVALQLLKACHDPGWFWDTEIVLAAEKKGYSIKEVPVAFLKRSGKTSTVQLIPDTLQYFKSIYRYLLRNK